MLPSVRKRQTAECDEETDNRFSAGTVGHAVREDVNLAFRQPVSDRQRTTGMPQALAVDTVEDSHATSSPKQRYAVRITVALA